TLSLCRHTSLLPVLFVVTAPAHLDHHTLSLHDALPICLDEVRKIIAVTDVPVRQVMIEARIVEADDKFSRTLGARLGYHVHPGRSEEHTSELQSRENLVCRLLLEKTKSTLIFSSAALAV